MALHFVYYNFCRVHQTLTKRANGAPTTPAMAAGLSDQPMTLEDVARLLEPKPIPDRRGFRIAS